MGVGRGEGIRVELPAQATREPRAHSPGSGLACPLGGLPMLPCEQKPRQPLSSRALGRLTFQPRDALTHLGTWPPPHDLEGVATQEDPASLLKSPQHGDDLLLLRVEWEEQLENETIVQNFSLRGTELSNSLLERKPCQRDFESSNTLAKVGSLQKVLAT